MRRRVAMFVSAGMSEARSTGMAREAYQSAMPPCILARGELVEPRTRPSTGSGRARTLIERKAVPRGIDARIVEPRRRVRQDPLGLGPVICSGLDHRGGSIRGIIMQR